MIQNHFNCIDAVYPTADDFLATLQLHIHEMYMLHKLLHILHK